MHKYVYLTLGLIFLSVSAQAAGCAGGAGTTVTGVDGHTYCQSKRNMNWWSAFAWCEGANMTLISLEDCNGIDGTVTGNGNEDCPNFKNKGSGTVWTSSVPRGNQAYSVNLSNGTVGTLTDRANSDFQDPRALCK